jgi:flagellar biosynthetic protein FliR
MMSATAGPSLANWVASCLLLSLRVTPLFLFAPPFTLVRAPRLVLALIGIALSVWILSAEPGAVLIDIRGEVIALAAFREAFLGLLPVLALQLAFAGLALAGRTLDIESGFGLAVIIDPSTRAQMPLLGTFFAYLAAVTFFAMHSEISVLRFYVESLRAVPLGTFAGGASASAVGVYFTACCLLGLGCAGVVMVGLFLIDVVVAMLSRTVPQMNALLLGVQVKAIAVTILMPLALAASAGLTANLVASAFAAMARMI